MTRFIHARARLMQVKARLPALRTRLSASLTEQTSASAASPATPQDAPALAPELSVLLDESGLAALARALDVAPQSDAATQDALDLPPALETALDVLTVIQPAPDAPDLPSTPETAPDAIPPDQDAPDVIPETEESEDEEETKKQPAIQFPRPPALPAQQTPEEEETLLVSMSELLKAREARQAAAGNQNKAVSASRPGAETTPGQAEVTDVTTKISILRSENA